VISLHLSVGYRRADHEGALDFAVPQSLIARAEEVIE